MASSLMATQTTLLRVPTTTTNRRLAAAVLPSRHSHSRSRSSSLRYLTVSNPNSLRLSPIVKPYKSPISASAAPQNPVDISEKDSNSVGEILSGSTRTITTLAAVALTASKFLTNGLFKLGLQLREPLLRCAGPAFFAAARDVPTGSLNTPFTVVAAGMAKWLDLYSGVLMVRVLLSWFPNIPWDRQPLSAIRDLCDPYLNLFRNIIPPIFNTLDVSPLLAFAVLGTLGSILNSTRQSY